MLDPYGDEISEDIIKILEKYGLKFSTYTFYEDDEGGGDYQMYVAELTDGSGISISELEYTMKDIYAWLRENEQDLSNIIKRKREEEADR